jgi:hypothetical protein
MWIGGDKEIAHPPHGITPTGDKEDVILVCAVEKGVSRCDQACHIGTHHRMDGQSVAPGGSARVPQILSKPAGGVASPRYQLEGQQVTGIKRVRHVRHGLVA